MFTIALSFSEHQNSDIAVAGISDEIHIIGIEIHIIGILHEPQYCICSFILFSCYLNLAFI